MTEKKTDILKVNVRQATAEDYKGVLDINRDVYDGFDYLPSLYFTFLHHPDIYMFVGEHNGKLVSLTGAWLMEDRTYACGISGRTNPDYQHRGISTQVEMEMEKFLRNLLPHPYYVSGTAVYQPKRHSSESFKMRYRIALEWNHLVYSNLSAAVVNAQLNNAVKRFGRSPIVFSVKKTAELLKHPVTKKILSKDGDFIPSYNLWLPIKISDKNLENLAKLYPVLFTVNGDLCQAVSFRSAILYPHKPAIRLDIYYHGDDDVTIYASHVCAHLRHVKESAKGIRAYYIMCHFPKAISPKAAEKVLQPVLGNRFIGTTVYFEETGTICMQGTQKTTPFAKL